MIAVSVLVLNRCFTLFISLSNKTLTLSLEPHLQYLVNENY